MTTFEPITLSARFFAVAVSLAVFLVPAPTSAAIDGEDFMSDPTPTITLTASEGYVSFADGASVYSWGYGFGVDGIMQLPGPTLIVERNAVVTITLENALPVAAGNASIVFPGQEVMATGGVPGSLTREAPNGGSVTYTFTATNPGTYQYHSGTQPDLQVEMGLYGTLIVRPDSLGMAGCATAAYDHPGACYDREYLYVLSEVDYDVHVAAELQSGGPGPIELPVGAFVSEYYLINGRVGPDTMAASSMPGDGPLPHQPYGSLSRMHPGEKVLIRMTGAGRESHPFHHHGNHSRVIARDGRMLVSHTDPTKLAGPLLFTLPSTPGGTTDAIFEWTGKDLGWDMYGHVSGGSVACVDTVNNETGALGSDGYDDAGDNAWEWCADHEREIPVTLPDLSSLTFGGFWGGSPYLGDPGSLPPGEGGLNPDFGFSFIWHSHTERELINNDVFPGGMMTFMIVEAPWIPIP
jgi:hypothetical protein